MQIAVEPRAKHDAKYDILKFVLSLMVVTIHGAIGEVILYPWVRLAVPLFFVLTSYFLFLKLNCATPVEEYSILKQFTLRNIRLYLFWFVVLLPVTVYIRRDVYFCGVKGLLNFISGLFFGSTFVASWYITASIIGIHIIYFLSKRINSFLLGIIALSFFLIVTFWSNYSFLVTEECWLVRILSWYNNLANPVCSFPAAVFWVYVGKCFAQNKRKAYGKWKSPVYCLISAVGLYCEWFILQRQSGIRTNDSYIMLMPTVIFLFMCIQNIKPVEREYGVRFRRASTVIYVTHGSVLQIIGFMLRKGLSIDSNILNVALTIICSMTIYVIMEIALCRWKNKKCAEILKYGF